MKRIAAPLFVLYALALPLCADEFTNMIHALAVKAASLGTYDATQVNVDYEIDNYYSPQMWEQYFASAFGSIAGERTFLAMCHNYTVYAYNDIKTNQRKYNNAGMNGDQFLRLMYTIILVSLS